MTREQVESAIAVMEDLLNFLYDLDYKAMQARGFSKKGVLKSLKLDAVQ